MPQVLFSLRTDFDCIHQLILTTLFTGLDYWTHPSTFFSVGNNLNMVLNLLPQLVELPFVELVEVKSSTYLLLGHCNKMVCFWSPPASILRAIQKNYYYAAHAQLCNCAMLVACQELKTAILNAAIYLNHLRVFGWQILKSVVPTDAYSTIFHNAVLPSVVDDGVIIMIITACPHQK